MAHPLVDQLRYTREQCDLGLEGLSEDEATRHFGQMNCISWIVGHLAAQEHRSWFEYAQGRGGPFPELEDYATGAPMSTPALKRTLDLWRNTALAADPYLDTLTTSILQSEMTSRTGAKRLIGSMVRRVTYHYWYHTGEIQSIRQMLGHKDLPAFIGPIDAEAPYRPEDPS